MTRKQIEYAVDVLKTGGLASFIGSAAEAALNGARLDNTAGIAAGLITIWIGFWLTKKLNGDKV